MSDELEREFAREIMKRYGIQLTDIPPKDTQTPDFECTLGSDRYTIELKKKEDDPIETAKFIEEFEKGGIVQEIAVIEPRPRLNRIVKDGVRQISAHDPGKSSYSLVWMHCAGRQPDIHYAKSLSTFLGRESLISLNRKHWMWCYYFRDSTFFRLKEKLDAVILTMLISEKATFLLCVNSCSPRYMDFKQSEIFKRMPSKAFLDPIEEEQSGHLIADCALDRKDEGAVLKYLQSKYKLEHLQTIPMNHYSGIQKIPK